MRKLIQYIYSVLFLVFTTSVVYGGLATNQEITVFITAHRGNSSEFPENIIPAFKSAIDLRLDWAELDIFTTKDGLLVVTHDARTGRVGDKDMVIADHTYQELQTVDVAYDFRKQHNLSLTQCPRQTIPLLEDVLLLFSKSTTTKISIQPKTDCVQAAVEMIKRLNVADKVGFNEGSLKYMALVKKLAPQIPVFWDRPHNSDIDADIKIAKLHGFEALVINRQGITAEKISKVKAAGIQAGVWTVNDTDEMKRFIQLGVQRFYTDEPQKLKILQKDLETVFCEGRYKQHLQGFCVDPDGNIYWSWTDRLVKTNAQGKMLASVAAPSHQGDLCVSGSSIYVAVNLGKFNEAKPLADSWIFQFDRHDLREIRRIPVPELVYGAGGMAYHNGKFFVIGGLPIGESDNKVYQYDQQLKFEKSYPLNSGYTKMGIQTIAYGNHSWWFGCYGAPEETLQFNEKFELVARHHMQTSLGIDIVQPGYLLISNNSRSTMLGHMGYIQKKKIDHE